MRCLLMNLRHVPEDELEEIRELLERHGFDYYETPPHRWGISAGGIWLRNDERLAEAKAVLAEYQGERQQRARAQHAADLRAGRAETLLGRVRQRPLQTLVYLLAIALLLYVSIKPFVDLIG